MHKVLRLANKIGLSQELLKINQCALDSPTGQSRKQLLPKKVMQNLEVLAVELV